MCVRVLEGGGGIEIDSKCILSEAILALINSLRPSDAYMRQ